MTTKTTTTDRPITLHGSCHVPHSFCDGIELCSIPYRNLVPEKSGTRLTDTRASFWYQTTGTSFWYQFLWHVSPALVSFMYKIHCHHQHYYYITECTTKKDLAVISKFFVYQDDSW